MALLPAGIKARSPPSGCLPPSEVCPPPSEVCPVFLSPVLPSLTSAAVPALARRVPPGLRFPLPGALSSQTSAGFTPPFHSFFCSERPSLYHFLSFFSCLKKKKNFHTYCSFVPGLLQVECKLLCEGSVFLGA